MPDEVLLQRYADGFNRSSALNWLGVRIDFPGGAKVRARIDAVQAAHRGGLGGEAVHGGILAALFDLVIGCTPALVDPLKRSATMQLSMNFERPVRGAVVVAEAWIDRAGGRTVYASARILDEAGEVCARCQGLARTTDLPWADGESPAADRVA